MPIESHIKMLQRQHPEEPLEIIRLACYLSDDVDKAKKYARILQSCNDYMDIAYNVVKPMYVKCLIDRTIAKKEKTFITILLLLSPYGKEGNPHSARYHIDLMLGSPEVRREREEYARKRRNEWNDKDRESVTIEISSKCREVTMPILESLIKSGAITLVDTKSNAQRKLNKSIRYVVHGSREDIVKSVILLDLHTKRFVDGSPQRRSILAVPNRNRYLGIKPGIKVEIPGNILEVPGNPNINKLRTLVQKQYGLVNRKIVAQSAEPARRIRYEKVLGCGIRVIVD